MGRLPTENIDYTSRDYEAFREGMLEALQEKMPEYTDLSSTDAGVVILECLANGLDVLSLYLDAVANDVLLPTTQDRRMAVILAKNLGYTPYNQTASITPVIFKLKSNENTEETVIPKGTIVTTTPDDEDLEVIMFETESDLIIPPGCYGNEQDEKGNYKYMVNAIQGETVSDENLGISNGTSHQTFMLNYAEVLTDTINVTVEEDDNIYTWKQVDDFLGKDVDVDSRVFIVSVDDFDNCYIEFGNNVRGKIPPKDSQIYVSYRVGGGEIGNVQKNTIVNIEDEIPGVAFVTNPIATAVLGHEKETLEEIKENAPASVRTKDRAITLNDYSDLLKVNNKGDMYAILNSKALVETDDPLKVTLYYQPREGYFVDKALEKTILDFFAERTIIGTSLVLKPYIAYSFNLGASLIVSSDYNQSEVEEEVKDYILNTFFAYGNFTFGDSFIKSDLESEVIRTFPGVRAFRVNSPEGEIITIADNQIFSKPIIQLIVSGGK